MTKTTNLEFCQEAVEEPALFYVKALEIASASKGEELPAGSSELVAWNVTHSELVEYVAALVPDKLYRSAFVAVESWRSWDE